MKITKPHDCVWQMDKFLKHTEINSGDVVELGFGKGSSSRRICDYLRDNNFKNTYWIYDSFKGFPERSEFDPNWVKSGDWTIPIENAITFKKEYDSFDINIVEGFVEETLLNPENRPEKISFMHIDLDLYVGYKYSLEYLYDFVIENGMILLDEYNQPADDTIKWKGAKIAIDNFIEKNHLLNDGRALIVKNNKLPELGLE